MDEIGKTIETCGFRTNFHDQGEGQAVVLLHGSGAGVSAWANWRNLIPRLSKKYRVIAPDLVGFGFTQTPQDFEFEFMSSWIDQVRSLLEQLSLENTYFVGNSFGGALAL